MITILNSACIASSIVCVLSMIHWVKGRRTHMLIYIAKILAASLTLLALGMSLPDKLSDIAVINKELDMILGSIIGALFVGAINKLQVDVFSKKSIMNMISSLKLYREVHGQYHVRPDKYKTASRIAVAIGSVVLIGFLPIEKKILFQLLVVGLAAGNIMLNPRYIGWCPYCNHQISGLTRHSTIAHCVTCHSAVAIENGVLTRILGRASEDNRY